MKKIICFLLTTSLILSSCANVNQFQSQRNTTFQKASAELKSIDENCKKLNDITKEDIGQINDPAINLTKNQYAYGLCYNGAKYIAFEKYFEEKQAWKRNLSENDRILRNLYLKRISKQKAETLTDRANDEFQKKEKVALDKVLANLQDKDKKDKNIAVLGVVALALVAANGGAGGGNTYSNSYAGNCACPYDLDSAGHRCGARSAYSRSGGASPHC